MLIFTRITTSRRLLIAFITGLFTHLQISLAGDLDIHFGSEIKTHYRDSQYNRFPVPNPPGARLETVDPGSHFELSNISIFTNVQYLEWTTLKLKIDFIDIYDRNSTSDDKQVDVDEWWLRFGHEVKPGKMPVFEDTRNLYLKIGKFGKFERQTDRHLESYGLVSTAFNRFEDMGMELGMDINSHFYLKGSLTSGNPVFIRDPNALAGDNGTSDLLRRNDPELNNGIVINYDAEVEDLEFDHRFMEKGLGIGYRMGNDDAMRTLDFMIFGYERDLQDEADLFGTLYGGDLDIFSAPNVSINPPGLVTVNGLTGDYKRDYGANLWIYYDNYALFGQYVWQDIGGLQREGWEIEFSRQFQLPEFWQIDGNQLFYDLAPAIRYSYLDPDFQGPGTFPALSIFWPWKKIDVGARIGLYSNLDLTLEYSFNEFEKKGKDGNNDEFLTTLRWRWEY